MLNITPTSIFPLKYPKGDSTIPEKGAKAVPVDLDWSKSTSYSVSLLVVQDQKDFGPLRCIWIDASANTHPITVAVNGTEQIFTIQPGTANYYAVVNLNIPVVSFTIGAGEATLTRVIFLNFVPEISMAGQLTIAGPINVTGNVAVTNFPANQAVNVTNFPATQTIAGNVAVTNFPANQAVNVTNFPAVQPVSGNVAVTNFPATQTIAGTVTANQGTNPWVVSLASTTITGTVAVTQSGAWTTGRTWNLTSANDSVSTVQSGAWNVGITGTPNVNAIQSGPWVVQQGGAPWSDNLTQVGGSAISLGQKTSAASIPVVIASDQSTVTTITTSTAFVLTSIGYASGTRNILATTSKAINFVRVTIYGATISAGISTQIKDGNGNTILNFQIPALSTAATIVDYIAFENMFLSLSNSGLSPTITQSVATVTGLIGISIGYQ